MSFHLESKSGETLRVSGGHWAVYLHLARCFGWNPIGTIEPAGYESKETWQGSYDSNDGQIVTEEDALKFANHLNAAARYAQIDLALSDVISQVEALVEKMGTQIPSEMKMKPSDFYTEFSPLLMFLYKGSFSIN